jgi:hypothetical protein
MTSKRLAVLDFSEGFMYAPSVLLIPMPQSTVNMAAVVKPFQLAVKKIACFEEILLCYLFKLKLINLKKFLLNMILNDIEYRFGLDC